MMLTTRMYELIGEDAASNLESFIRKRSYLQQVYEETGNPTVAEKLAKLNHLLESVNPGILPASPHNLPESPSTEQRVLERYQQLSSEQRYELLRKAMSCLLEAKDERGLRVFRNKKDWMGVYLVLRDRLGVRCTQSSFATHVLKFTPEDCPEDLRISNGTMTNFSKVVTEEKAYYKMKHNPFASLCETLWDIILQMLFTKL